MEAFCLDCRFLYSFGGLFSLMPLVPANFLESLYLVLFSCVFVVLSSLVKMPAFSRPFNSLRVTAWVRYRAL
jgi:hypothetical protein